jgi:hypothetical protein
MTEIIVLDYSNSNVDIYKLDITLTNEQVENFLFNTKGYKESEIEYMFAEKLYINNYGDCC